MPIEISSPSIIRSKRNVLFAVLLFFIIICLFFWQAIISQKSLLPTDMIFDFSFFRGISPNGHMHASNGLLSDVVLKFYPWSIVTREALREQKFPFWNPYTFAGTPQLANAESSVLYPLSLLGLIFSEQAAFGISAFIRLFIAGLGMYAFMRQIHVKPFTSIVTGIAFMLSGSLVVWINYPVSGVYIWLPTLFWLSKSYISKGNLLKISLLGSIIGIMLLAGHFQVAFMSLAFWGIYCLYQIIQMNQPKDFLRKLLNLGLAASIGLLIASVLILPFWSWLQQTGEAQRRQQELSVELINPDFAPDLAVTAIGALIPNFNGNPTWGTPQGFYHGNFIEQNVYIGIIPLFTAIMILIYAVVRHHSQDKADLSQLIPRVDRRQVLFFAGTGLFFLALAVNFPIIDLINRLPFFNVIASDRYRLIYSFCFIILAGLGIDYLLDTPASSQLIRRLALISGGIGLIIGLSLFGFHSLVVYLESWMRSFGRLDAIYPILVEKTQPANPEMYFPSFVALAFALLLLVYSKLNLRSVWIKSGIFALLLFDLFSHIHNFNPFIPADQVFPETPGMTILKTASESIPRYRVVDLFDDLPPNITSVYGVAQISGSEFPTRRYTEFVKNFGGELYGGYRIRFTGVDPRLLQLLSVKFVVSHTDPSGIPAQRLTEVYRDEHVRIYENSDLLSHLYTVHDQIIIQDDSEVLEKLRSDDFDPWQQVIITPDTSSVPIASANLSTVQDSIQITSYTTQHVEAQVKMASDGYLVFGEANYPGWKAYVDQHETEIHRANYLFQAVFLPEGVHTIRFEYVAPGFEAGLTLTIIGLTLSSLVLAIGVFTYLKNKPLEINLQPWS